MDLFVFGFKVQKQIGDTFVAKWCSEDKCQDMIKKTVEKTGECCNKKHIYFSLKCVLHT